jgi:hypothetical protein
MLFFFNLTLDNVKKIELPLHSRSEREYCKKRSRKRGKKAEET